MGYNREEAVSYAHKWAFKRNPEYYSFDGLGGDCTNFISQCLYAGCKKMNYARDIGWYYRSQNDRAAAWTGVEYLYRFLITNKGPGPYGSELPLENAETGDIIQFSYDGKRFGHSALVVEAAPEILLSHHSSLNADDRTLSDYVYVKLRLIHIEGVN